MRRTQFAERLVQAGAAPASTGVIRFRLREDLFTCARAGAVEILDPSGGSGSASSESGSGTCEIECEEGRELTILDVCGIVDGVALAGSMGHAREYRCESPNVYELTGIGEGCCESSSSSGSSESECHTIPGIEFEELPIVLPANVDWVLGIKDGCLVRVPMHRCYIPESESSDSF